MKSVYVVIPVYNEATVVGSVIEEVCKQYPNVVGVDDGSRDNSGEEIKKAGGILVQHAVNVGQGGALQTGIDYALKDKEAEYLVTYDADGQHSLKDVGHMLDVIQKEKVDIVLGSRFLGKTERLSPLKKVILKLAIQFSNHTSGLKLTDTHNGLRVFNRHFAENLNIQNPDFSHASEIIDKIARGNYKYCEVPVTIKYTDYSKAKGQSIFNAVNMGFDILLGRIIK
ncbi:MAG TPA: glycosyltransferase family 2 protein [Candidatus Saccharimonadales bacterium]|nr:glycosyltransferase family 2 protein [Candidatus Saccharimonadales bacterium]